jgi:hypothetical protein
MPTIVKTCIPRNKLTLRPTNKCDCGYPAFLQNCLTQKKPNKSIVLQVCTAVVPEDFSRQTRNPGCVITTNDWVSLSCYLLQGLSTTLLTEPWPSVHSFFSRQITRKSLSTKPSQKGASFHAESSWHMPHASQQYQAPAGVVEPRTLEARSAQRSSTSAVARPSACAAEQRSIFRMPCTRGAPMHSPWTCSRCSRHPATAPHLCSVKQGVVIIYYCMTLCDRLGHPGSDFGGGSPSSHLWVIS